MTRRQREALDFIINFMRQHRMSPSIREIAAELGDSGISNTHRTITRLIADGHLRHTARRHRNLALVSPLALFSTDALRAELQSRGAAA